VAEGAPDAADVAHLTPVLQALWPGRGADAGTAERLGRLRRTCRPHLRALAAYLLLDLPEWGDAPSPRRSDDVMARLTNDDGSQD